MYCKSAICCSTWPEACLDFDCLDYERAFWFQSGLTEKNLTGWQSKLGSSVLPVCGACCISPPGGRIPLRLRLGPSMGLAPLINV